MALSASNLLTIGNAILKSLITAKGQIIVGTGADTVGILSIGYEGQVLKSGSSTLEYASVTSEIFLSCAGGYSPATTAPDGGFNTLETITNHVTYKGTKFVAEASADKYHEFGCPLPANFKLDSVITAKAYFVTTSTDASSHTIIFGLQGVCIADDGNFDVAYGTAQEVTETVESSIYGKIIITAASSPIYIAGTPTAGKWCQFRTYRKGTDTYVDDVTLLGWMITYIPSGP